MHDRRDGEGSSHPSCIFYKIIAREEPCIQLYEDDNTLAFMDKHPVNDGHCLVIPKSHYETIFETPSEDFAPVARTVVKIAAAVQCALQPAGLTLVRANGPAAGQSVQHLHVHVLPRRDEDHLPINWSRHHEGYPIHIAELAARIRGTCKGQRPSLRYAGPLIVKECGGDLIEANSARTERDPARRRRQPIDNPKSGS